MDFTLQIYKNLLEALKTKYKIISFYEFLQSPNKDEKTIILRHDVDKKPYNSFQTARIENKLGIKATYYFRIAKESNNPKFIEKIRDLGHEIGYHYEDLALCHGNYEKAIHSFRNNLNYFRTFYHVKTICMHGSPTSIWDNKLLWSKYSYRDLKIIGEPYFDIDYNQVAYVTDTGRSWDGGKVSIRDKVKNNSLNVSFSSTLDFIALIKENKLPDKIMITIHPQRWSSNIIEWYFELILQKMKNIIKRILVLIKKK